MEGMGTVLGVLLLLQGTREWRSFHSCMHTAQCSPATRCGRSPRCVPQYTSCNTKGTCSTCASSHPEDTPISSSIYHNFDQKHFCLYLTLYARLTAEVSACLHGIKETAPTCVQRHSVRSLAPLHLTFFSFTIFVTQSIYNISQPYFS